MTDLKLLLLTILLFTIMIIYNIIPYFSIYVPFISILSVGTSTTQLRPEWAVLCACTVAHNGFPWMSLKLYCSMALQKAVLYYWTVSPLFLCTTKCFIWSNFKKIIFLAN